MTLVSFLSNIRNAAIMNAIIVIFHIWVAIAIEGIGFLAIVLPIGALVAGAYYFKGKLGALLLLLPTLAYLVVVPEMINGLSNASGPENEIGSASEFEFLNLFEIFFIVSIFLPP